MKMRTKDSVATFSDCAIEDSDTQVIKLTEYFWSVENKLDRLVQSESEDSTSSLLLLHQEWADICARVAALPSSTRKAQRAKAAMLLALIQVVAPAGGSRQPHEMLAASLARDLLC